MNAPLLTKLGRDRIAELLDLEGYNPLNAHDAKVIEERRDEALRLRAEARGVWQAMTPLDETQPRPVFSRIPPGVYIHAPLCVCDYCEGTVPECPMCGGVGPYRPLINLKWLRPFTTPC